MPKADQTEWTDADLDRLPKCKVGNAIACGADPETDANSVPLRAAVKEYLKETVSLDMAASRWPLICARLCRHVCTHVLFVFVCCSM